MKLTKKQFNVIAPLLPRARNEKISPMKFLNALLHDELQLDLDVSALSLDGTGARKNGPQSIGKTRGGKNTKI